LWDQEWMQNIIESFTSMAWEQYTSSPRADHYIQAAIRATGWLYTACAIASLLIGQKLRQVRYLLLLGAASLSFLAFLDYKEKFFQLGDLMEHVIQFCSPVLLYLALFSRVRISKLVLFAKIAAAVTFTGHALYAWGYYPQPGPFVDMFINVFGLSEALSRILLQAAAVLDVLAAIMIFIPRASRIALLYCVLWGGATAFARMLSGFDMNFIGQSLNQYAFETIFRLAHALLPFWIFRMEGGVIFRRNRLKHVPAMALEPVLITTRK
jgi:hypothetical protein